MAMYNLRRLLLPMGYMVVLFILSSIPGDLPLDEPLGRVFQWVSPAWQNLLHIPLYAGLTATWLWALASYELSRVRWLALAFTFTFVWGILDEVHQMNVPGRYGSLTDMALDVLGAAIVVFYMCWKGFKRT